MRFTTQNNESLTIDRGRSNCTRKVSVCGWHLILKLNMSSISVIKLLLSSSDLFEINQQNYTNYTLMDDEGHSIQL